MLEFYKFIEYCKTGKLERLKHLVEAGCDPTTYCDEPIRWASYYGQLEVVKYLVEVGCDPEGY